MIPFSPPRMDQKIIDEVIDTLKSGWITTGPKTKLLEKKIASYVGIQNVLCLNSATAGLELMLRWYGVQEGDEVIIPAYTYTATANVVVHCGATPVFVDISSDFNVDATKIIKAITPNTKVIMPVDMGGFPCDYDAINTIVNAPEIKRLFKARTPEQEKLKRILVLNDAAHSFGGFYKGKRVGSSVDLSVFSFHAVKNLTTAEGGAVCLNLPAPFDNAAIYKDLCVKSLHGQNKDALAKTQKGNWRYDIVEAGYKWNMPDILASIALVELERYDDDTLVRRRAIFDKYSRELSKYPWAQIPVYEDKDRISSYHVYLLRIKDVSEEKRDLIIQKIFDKDVSVNVHFEPLPMKTFYKNMGYKMANYPVSYDYYSREISLPVFYDLNDDLVEVVIKAVVDSVEEVINA